MIEEAMKVVIDALEELGIRKDCIVLVGGEPLDERSAQSVGADIYCRDVSAALDTTAALQAQQHGPVAA